MKLTFKRFLSVIMSLIMLLGIMQINVFAASSDNMYDLYVAGVQVTEQNRNDILGDGGSVKFNVNTSTLTLTNTNITKTVYTPLNATGYAGIYADVNLTIELIGVNVIDLRDLEIEDKGITRSNGIKADGNLKIKGSGSLFIATPDAVSKSEGIYAYNHSVYLEGGCTVEIETGDSFAPTGIITNTHDNRIEITDGSTLKIKTGDIYADQNTQAIIYGLITRTLLVTDNSEVNIQNGNIILPDNADSMIADINNAVSCQYMYVYDSSVTAIAGKSGGVDELWHGSPVKGSTGISRTSDMNYDEIDIQIHNSTVIASGYDQAFSSLSAIKDSEIYSGVEFYCSNNIDGSNLKKIEVTSTGKDIEKPYVMIVPEGSYDPPEKSFFEKIADFFRNLFESIVQFFDYIF